MARQGKIARLPHNLREQVNRRLLDGLTYAEILTWLNQEPAAIEIWNTAFEGSPANPQNMSEWRQGGYIEWLNRRQKTENLKTLAAFSVDLAKAGGNVADGAAAIAAGHLLETLENIASDEDADLSALTQAVATLRRGDLDRSKLQLERQKLKNKEKEIQLSREKFEVGTIKVFMKWASSKEAQAILESSQPKTVKMELLRERIFGKRKTDERTATDNP
jgi:hypothetical protein